MIAIIREEDSWLYFRNPVKKLETHNLNEVKSLLEEASKSGLYAAGFISYEASSAFDDVYKHKQNKDFPLLSMGLYKSPVILKELPDIEENNYSISELIPSIGKQNFLDKIAKIKLNIEAGNTYQVNYTYRLNGKFKGDCYQFFKHLIDNQNAKYASYISTNNWSICSASPELFFSLKSNILITKPMKGTARRGKNSKEDIYQSKQLRNSKKNQAENIMIVDMLRNDIGKIADNGTISTVKTFELERYPTLWQMTSTIKGVVRCKVPEIMKALFPCASITGAPKIKTMEIIDNIECSSRDVYTGSIGYIHPNNDALFNVAIRTAIINKKNSKIVYSVGSGIVWDSDGEEEYLETQMKANILLSKRYKFDLIETMLWEPNKGVKLLNLHLDRINTSADFFNRSFNKEQAIKLIKSVSNNLSLKLRLLLKPDNTLLLEEHSFKCLPLNKTLNLKVSKNETHSSNIFLYHKTSIRDHYEKAKTGLIDYDEVILWNENKHITEGTIYNIAILKDKIWITPPLECGLLNGVMREKMIKSGKLLEKIITLEELYKAEKIILFNSVQGIRNAILL